MDKNKIPLYLSIVSGFLLILSGSNGYSTWKSIESYILNLFQNNIPLQIAFIVLLFIASLGGLSVIIGGIFLYKQKLIPGRILIMVGSGAGMLYLMTKIYLIIFTEEVVFDLFSSFASLGIILGIAAQITAMRLK